MTKSIDVIEEKIDALQKQLREIRQTGNDYNQQAERTIMWRLNRLYDELDIAVAQE